MVLLQLLVSASRQFCLDRQQVFIDGFGQRANVFAVIQFQQAFSAELIKILYLPGFKIKQARDLLLSGLNKPQPPLRPLFRGTIIQNGANGYFNSAP